MFNISSVCSDVCNPKSIYPCCDPENKLASVKVTTAAPVPPPGKSEAAKVIVSPTEYPEPWEVTSTLLIVPPVTVTLNTAVWLLPVLV
mgnify:CR=1 FL=1